MTTGQVTATSLNLRDAPSGNIIGMLTRGDVVEILSTANGWCRVSATIQDQSTVGFASAQFIGVNSGASAMSSAPAPTSMPMADDAAHPVTVAGVKAIGPDGQPFARVNGPGFATTGITRVSAWLSGGGDPGGLSSSVVNTLRAVSENEGLLEAINSYDRAFMSFGVFQWTAGVDAGQGELAGLLALIEANAPDAFADCFQPYGLGSQMGGANATTGFLTLAGAPLTTAAAKDQLRSAEWAYRFWRAGHHEGVRQAQLALAGSRITRFRGVMVQGFSVSQWLTSEYAIALVLDQHVNRPSDVAGTLGSAIARLAGGGPPPNPTAWATVDEAKLTALYVEERDKTKMTDPAKRATAIADCVHAGWLSDERGSFAP